jgi:mannose-6-phosphate isomerase-like protein (cupin superfamily)
VLDPGTSVRSPRGTVVEIVDNRPDRFVLRRTLPPGTGRTAPHRHFDGVERFRVLEGEAVGRVGRTKRVLRPGDVMEVPVGSMHIHPHTRRGTSAVVEHEIEPRVRFVEVYFRSWFAWLAEGRVDRQDEPTLLGVMAVVGEGAGGTYIAGVPVALQKAIAPSLARVAARRGYRATTQ